MREQYFVLEARLKQTVDELLMVHGRKSESISASQMTPSHTQTAATATTRAGATPPRFVRSANNCLAWAASGSCEWRSRIMAHVQAASLM
jgi:hypothetical protein